LKAIVEVEIIKVLYETFGSTGTSDHRLFNGERLLEDLRLPVLVGKVLRWGLLAERRREGILPIVGYVL
jgi:hypothetical protein